MVGKNDSVSKPIEVLKALAQNAVGLTAVVPNQMAPSEAVLIAVDRRVADRPAAAPNAAALSEVGRKVAGPSAVGLKVVALKVAAQSEDLVARQEAETSKTGPSGISVGRSSPFSYSASRYSYSYSYSKTPESIQVDHHFRETRTPVFGSYVNDFPIRPFEYEYRFTEYEYEYEKNQWYELPATIKLDGSVES